MSTAPPSRRDARLPRRQRVDDLLAQLTLDERIAMLHQFAPAVERLRIAAFRTGQEALHGVAWMGPATVFPQAVGLGASWNPDLLRRIGEAVSTEARGMRARDPRVGLNVWAPVVNLLRDPRWGRNEEGYSEDPALTAALATAYTRGLRGGHPRYWRTAPVLKHWLAHSNETGRDTTSASVPPRVLHEYDLPAFRGPVEAGAVAGVMPAYSLVNGRPNHLSPYLEEELRTWTDRELVVCSDAGAPSNIAGSQGYHATHEEAAAAALRAGVDSFTDHDQDPAPTTARVRGALDRGLIGEHHIDTAVRRLLAMRRELGEFDPEDDPYAGLGPEHVDTPAHRELAREAAEQAVVLLKNDGLLPLSAHGDGHGGEDAGTEADAEGGAGTVAVIGPMADACKRDWYSGDLIRRSTLRGALAERLGADRVVHADGSDRVRLRCASGGWLHVPAGPDGAGAPEAAPGSAGSLNPAHTEGRTDLPPVTRGEHPTELALTDWGGGVLTLRAPDGHYLSAAGDGFVRASAGEPGGWVVQETFALEPHGDGHLLRHLGSGRPCRLAPEGLRTTDEGEGPESAEVFTVEVTERGEDAAARAAAAARTVIVAAGNDPHINGRETEDRATLALPPAQERLWRAARAANPRTVLALVSSYPYAVPEADAELPAVLWTAHGGQAAGTALTRVLFGDVSPAGRLPQTWYAGDDGPPGLFDYDIIGARATYLYFDGTPLYPFGHGLSYSRFSYDGLAVTRDGDTLTAALTVTNTGDRDADEVVQLYARAVTPRVPRPHRQLVAHERRRLAAGETGRFTFTVPVAALGHWDVAHGRWTTDPGRYELHAGASSADIRLTAPVTVGGPPPAPRPVRESGLEAAHYDTSGNAVLVDRTKARGDAVAPADPGAAARLLFRACDFGPSAPDTAVLLAARAEPGEARIGLALADGTPLGDAVVPCTDGPYAYRAVELTLGGAPRGVRDLWITLRGAVRLARLDFGLRDASREPSRAAGGH
ncbi:glycoside hydrolase family 3 C-terminal domain-containing protein [Streptomyces xinghaiensis]|uniref:glycoside hydrolase family 3 C-terminal domain-containing protein n=1 Tax=Streptomyces xinghaiensis TaxID=1038928 RepID=UPI001EDED66C|nr:glycoside hydrolase family 3 C-terminal domain-containing protein [Streptomyces xinghaiensis]